MKYFFILFYSHYLLILRQSLLAKLLNVSKKHGDILMMGALV